MLRIHLKGLPITAFMWKFTVQIPKSFFYFFSTTALIRRLIERFETEKKGKVENIDIWFPARIVTLWINMRKERIDLLESILQKDIIPV